MLAFAEIIASARSAVFIWSMGITQHRFGVDNVQAIVNLALSRGFLGREKCGLMPIRGHSGVQGGAEVGAVPWTFPGGRAVGEDGASEMSKLWGFDVPDWRRTLGGRNGACCSSTRDRRAVGDWGRLSEYTARSGVLSRGSQSCPTPGPPGYRSCSSDVCGAL